MQRLLIVAALGVSAGCAAERPLPPQLPPDDPAFAPVYRGVETRLLDQTLVNFLVEMEGARAEADVADYARCAAAQYTLIRGYGFARHVRTSVVLEGSLWRADAVYTISPTLPDGAQTIDAEVTVEDCAARGIPTV